MKRYGNPEVMVTDRCPSNRAVMKMIGYEKRQETGRHIKNRAENSRLPFRRRERRCLASGESEVFRSSPQSFRWYTTISIAAACSSQSKLSYRQKPRPTTLRRWRRTLSLH